MSAVSIGNGFSVKEFGETYSLAKPGNYCEVFQGGRFVAMTKKASTMAGAIANAKTIMGDMSGIGHNGLGVKLSKWKVGA